MQTGRENHGDTDHRNMKFEQTGLVSLNTRHARANAPAEARRGAERATSYQQQRTRMSVCARVRTRVSVYVYVACAHVFVCVCTCMCLFTVSSSYACAHFSVKSCVTPHTVILEIFIRPIQKSPCFRSRSP